MNPRWEPEAIAYLEKIAETLPLPLLIKRFQIQASKASWVHRTDNAIKIQLKRMGYSMKALVGDVLYRDKLAQALGVRRETVRCWTRFHGLPYRRLGRNVAIKVRDFAAFCKQRPDLVKTLDPERLAWVLKDDALVAELNPDPNRYLHGRARPVQRLDTGEIYRSARAAARAVFLQDRSAICDAIRDGVPAAGTMWQWVDGGEVAPVRPVKKICEVCNSEFDCLRSRLTRRTCSKECSLEIRRRKRRQRMQQAG